MGDSVAFLYIYGMKLFLSVMLSAVSMAATAQPWFEGQLTYHVSVTSKTPGFSEADVRKLMAVSDQSVVFCKNGNYFRQNGVATLYSINKDKKLYFKFRSIDTLYDMDYGADTSRILGIRKSDSTFMVNNIPCKGIRIVTSNSAKTWRYTETLRNNPALDVDYALGQYNVYTRETKGAVYLWTKIELGFGDEVDSCVRIEQKPVDDQIFVLPNLPHQRFSAGTLLKRPEFHGGAQAWMKYLQANLDANLSLKYVKLPKGQASASQTVIVSFVVGADGRLSGFEVLNKDRVNPHLATEALRVVGESPRWEPARFAGETVTMRSAQPVVFEVRVAAQDAR